MQVCTIIEFSKIHCSHWPKITYKVSEREVYCSHFANCKNSNNLQPFTCLPNQVFPMRKKFSMPRKFSEMGICKLTNFSMVGFGEGGQEKGGVGGGCMIMSMGVGRALN